MTRGLVVAGPRLSQALQPKLGSFDIEDVSRLGVELLARRLQGWVKGG